MSIEEGSYLGPPRQEAFLEKEIPANHSARTEKSFIPSNLPGTDVSPAEVLRRLRALPRQERPEAIEQYREFVRKQKQELAFLYSDLTKTLEENPTLSIEELEQKITTEMDRLHISYNDRDIVVRTLERFDRRRRAITLARERYPKDADLYERLFGEQPEGSVEVIATPFMLYVRCHSKRDYARAYVGGHEPTTEDIKRANSSSGASFADAVIPGLAGALTIEKFSKSRRVDNMLRDPLSIFRKKRSSGVFGSLGDLPGFSRGTALHEQAHVIHRLFLNRDWSTERATHRDHAEGDTLERLLLNAARDWRERTADNRARTEMLAYLKDGSSRESIETLLLQKGGLYNYLNEDALQNLESHLRREAWEAYGPAEWSDAVAQRAAAIQESVRRVIEEYPADIHRALDVLEDLKSFYSVDAQRAYRTLRARADPPVAADRASSARRRKSLSA